MSDAQRSPSATLLLIVVLVVAMVGVVFGAVSLFGHRLPRPPRIPPADTTSYLECVKGCMGLGLTGDALDHCIDGCAKVNAPTGKGNGGNGGGGNAPGGGVPVARPPASQPLH